MLAAKPTVPKPCLLTSCKMPHQMSPKLPPDRGIGSCHHSGFSFYPCFWHKSNVRLRPPSKPSILSADAKRKSSFPALNLDNAGLCPCLLRSLWHLKMLSISLLHVQSVSSGESNPRQVLTLTSLFFSATMIPMAHQPANRTPMWSTNSV